MILEILTSKVFWGILGPLAAALWVYLKGREDQRRSNENAAHKAREELRRQVLEAERKNQEKEAEREKHIIDIRNRPDDDLIGVWKSKGWGSTKDSNKPSS